MGNKPERMGNAIEHDATAQLFDSGKAGFTDRIAHRADSPFFSSTILLVERPFQLPAPEKLQPYSLE
ncbi:hypothetical protein [Zavarzinella formosa]|uniref:hypothetical protein n=1 Tax=Zavarzinella formosa TaxID=360055 RepID=UPI001EE67DAC|nr:hypothetical protein [Zavarzinella formosa]